MRRPSRNKLAAAAAVAVVIGGGASAAVSATGPGRAKSGARSSVRAHRPVDLSAAAAYLGISRIELEAQLRSGKSLAQIAAATAGRSVGGLINTLVAEKRRRLGLLLARVPKRVSAEVNRSGGPGAGSRAGAAPGARARHRHSHLGGRQSFMSLAASYLGTSRAHIRHQLHAGRTLGEIADATPGKSASGLIATLVGARRAMLEGAVTAGRLSRARADASAARIAVRVTARVNHRRVKR